KINCGPLAGINENDIVPLAGLAKDKKIPVRFIELMPLGAAAAMRPIPADRVISLLEAAYGPLKPADAPRGNGPAEYFTVPGFAGRIGLIRAMSHCFCGTCNRLRLGSSGLLRPCLSSDLNLDLRGRIRANMPDSEIAETIREFVTHKPAGHHFTETAGKPEYSRTEMFRIGG
ncbi:MAG: GTP 3',8-cyclase MoaA, partial [Treponema sp.]|nr:GTP 3',8-cyclase MoaA [Treponema sp.]